MFDTAKVHTAPGEAPMLDIDVLLMDEDSQRDDALRAQLSTQEAAQWTRRCVRRHLI